MNETLQYMISHCVIMFRFPVIDEQRNRTKTMLTTPSHQEDVKSSARGSWLATIINRSMQNPEKRDYTVACVVLSEVKQFCQRGHLCFQVILLAAWLNK